MVMDFFERYEGKVAGLDQTLNQIMEEMKKLKERIQVLRTNAEKMDPSKKTKATETIRCVVKVPPPPKSSNLGDGREGEGGRVYMWRGEQENCFSQMCYVNLCVCMQFCSHWTGGIHGDRCHPVGLLCGLQCLLVPSL